MGPWFSCRVTVVALGGVCLLSFVVVCRLFVLLLPLDGCFGSLLLVMVFVGFSWSFMLFWVTACCVVVVVFVFLTFVVVVVVDRRSKRGFE